MTPGIFLQSEPRGPSILVEIPVTANGQGRVQIPDIAQLRSTPSQEVILNGMRLITPEVLVRGMLTGNVLAPIAELQKMAITLYAEGWEKGTFMPVLTFNDTPLPGGTFPHRYQTTYFASWRNVDWNQSYIQYANTTVSANTPYSVVFEVFYLKLNKMGQEITGPS